MIYKFCTLYLQCTAQLAPLRVRNKKNVPTAHAVSIRTMTAKVRVYAAHLAPTHAKKVPRAFTTASLFAAMALTLLRDWCRVWNARVIVTARNHRLVGLRTAKPAQQTPSRISRQQPGWICVDQSAILASIPQPDWPRVRAARRTTISRNRGRTHVRNVLRIRTLKDQVLRVERNVCLYSALRVRVNMADFALR